MITGKKAALRRKWHTGAVLLAAVLTSVMFGFTSGELAAMRAETPKGSLYGAVQASALPKAQQFCRWLLAARTEAALLG